MQLLIFPTVCPQTPWSSDSYNLSFVPFSMVSKPWVQELFSRWIQWDWTPQLCIFMGCGLCNHLHLLQREVFLNDR